MTPAELREKVARAIREHRERPADELASLAIYVVREAMREPSEEMTKRGRRSLSFSLWVAPAVHVNDAWRAMLAASPLREE